MGFVEQLEKEGIHTPHFSPAPAPVTIAEPHVEQGLELQPVDEPREAAARMLSQRVLERQQKTTESEDEKGISI